MAEKDLKFIENEIKKFDDKKFKVMFFVMDTKNTPIGSLAYIYETAYQLSEMGYNVHMLYAEQDFVGVRDWLGDKYADLPHHNIGIKRDEKFAITPADILFIPELFGNIMGQTKSWPCKRVALLQNLDYMAEGVSPGNTWTHMKIRDCIATSDRLAEIAKNYFPDIKTHVVRPSIPNYFFEEQKPKQLIINIIAKTRADFERFMKPFYWKHPELTWVAFRELKDLPRKDFAKELNKGAATVWIDTRTDFGYSALEAMAANNILIAKVPDNQLEWAFDKDGRLKDNAMWFETYDDAIECVNQFVQYFISDRVPENIYSVMKDTVAPYSIEMQKLDIENVYVKDIFDTHRKTLEIYLNTVNNVEEKQEKE